MKTLKVMGVWYAWEESFPTAVRPGRTKREAIQAARRARRKGMDGEAADFRIVHNLIDRPRPHRHPLLLRAEGLSHV